MHDLVFKPKTYESFRLRLERLCLDFHAFSFLVIISIVPGEFITPTFTCFTTVLGEDTCSLLFKFNACFT